MYDSYIITLYNIYFSLCMKHIFLFCAIEVSKQTYAHFFVGIIYYNLYLHLKVKLTMMSSGRRECKTSDVQNLEIK
jgi:hypothetical protein